MAGVEASGRNVEEAIENALDELGAQPDEVRVEVLSKGKSGILGVGGSEARVRAWLMTDEDAPAHHPTAAELTAAVPPEETSAFAEDAPAAEPSPLLVDEEGNPIDDAEYAARMLDKLLELMGVDADVSIRDPETPGDGLGMAKAVLDVEGDDLGILIGRRGETLQSLQYLLNLMVSRQLRQHVAFTIDIEGYRRRRERQLTTLARRMADQVRRTKRPVTLEPMPANERRIIHIALAEDRQVETSSSGDGDDRKVEISLRN